MTYDLEKAKLGREPIYIVEMDLDFCSLTYGMGPCQARLGISGSEKCFNTRRTCQDAMNYTIEPKTYVFASSNANLPPNLNAIPSVRRVSLAPTRIESRGLGLRASVTVEFRDHPHHDRGIDPYVADRSYDPNQMGSFWGKLKARNPFYFNRVLRIKTGYITQPWDDANFQTRTYLIDRIEGPDRNGNVRVVAKDPLKLADDDRARAPAPSTGVLLTALDDMSTIIELSPAGVGAEYPASGFVRIEDEIIEYSANSMDQLTIANRAAYNTEEDEHDIDSTVQLCIVYENERVDDVIKDLLQNYASVPSAYIPDADWVDEIDFWLQGSFINTILTEPEGINKLLTEITRDFLLNIWWDERDQEIKLRAVAPPRPTAPPPELNDTNHFIVDSLQTKDKPDERVSRVLVYYNRINPTGRDNAANFRELYVQADIESEQTEQYGSPKILDIKSRWFNQQSVAIALGGRTLSRFRDINAEISFRLDAKDSNLWTGDVFDIDSRILQNVMGGNLGTRMQVREVQEVENGTFYEYRAANLGIAGNFGLIGPDSLLDFPDESEDNRARYAFIAPDSGVFDDGTPAYRIA